MPTIKDKEQRVLKKADRVILMSEQFMDDNIPLITFSKMHQVPMYEWIQLAEGVKSKLIDKDSNRLVFYVVADEDSMLLEHRHDCEEHWKLINGQLLRDTHEGYIQPYQSHKFTFVAETTMIVEFLI
jgi:mannose-6-phosphate isomerase-like protein (cupin superfamily)